MNKYQILELARTYPQEVTLIKFKAEHYADFLNILEHLPYRHSDERIRLPVSHHAYILRVGKASPFSSTFGYSSIGYHDFGPPIPYTPSHPIIFTRNPHAKEVLLS